MPFCPDCKSEFIEGVTQCNDCGTELVPELTEAEHFSAEDYRLVYTCGQVYEAQMMKSNLESAGIESYILNETDRNFPGAGNVTLVKLFVKVESETDAREFIQKSNVTDTDEPAGETNA